MNMPLSNVKLLVITTLLLSLLPTPSLSIELDRSFSKSFDLIVPDDIIKANMSSFHGDFNPSNCIVYNTEGTDYINENWMLLITCTFGDDVTTGIDDNFTIIDNISFAGDVGFELDLFVKDGGKQNGQLGALLKEPQAGNYLNLLEVPAFQEAVSGMGGYKKFTIQTQMENEATIKLQFPWMSGERRRLLVV